MEYLERDPLPEECKNCTDVECDVCDIGLERWYIPEDKELELIKKGLLKALTRLENRGEDTTYIKSRLLEVENDLLKFKKDE